MINLKKLSPGTFTRRFLIHTGAYIWALSGFVVMVIWIGDLVSTLMDFPIAGESERRRIALGNPYIYHSIISGYILLGLVTFGYLLNRVCHVLSTAKADSGDGKASGNIALSTRVSASAVAGSGEEKAAFPERRTGMSDEIEVGWRWWRISGDGRLLGFATDIEWKPEEAMTKKIGWPGSLLLAFNFSVIFALAIPIYFLFSPITVGLWVAYCCLLIVGGRLISGGRGVYVWVDRYDLLERKELRTGTFVGGQVWHRGASAKATKYVTGTYGYPKTFEVFYCSFCARIQAVEEMATHPSGHIWCQTCEEACAKVPNSIRLMPWVFAKRDVADECLARFGLAALARPGESKVVA